MRCSTRPSSKLVIQRPAAWTRENSHWPSTWAESDPANEDLANEPESFRSAIADLHTLIDSVIATRDRAEPDHEMLDPEPPWGREFALSFAPDRPLPCRLARR